jgi:phosphohistidine phosphatase
MSRHLADQDVTISLVLCSSARRTRETVDLVNPPGEIRIGSGLYGASADHLLDRLRQVPEEVRSVMLVGHNPGLHELAIELAGAGTDLAQRKFPTGALATLTFAGTWEELGPGRAELEGFVVPRELD